MRPLGIGKGDPIADQASGREAVGDRVQVDRLVFERAPQPFDEDVVYERAPAVYRDADAGRLHDASGPCPVRDIVRRPGLAPGAALSVRPPAEAE